MPGVRKGHDDAEVVVVIERGISKLPNRDEARSASGKSAVRGSGVQAEQSRASDCWPQCLAWDDPVRGPGCASAPVRLHRVPCGGAFDCSSSAELSTFGLAKGLCGFNRNT